MSSKNDKKLSKEEVDQKMKEIFGNDLGKGPTEEHNKEAGAIRRNMPWYGIGQNWDT